MKPTIAFLLIAVISWSCTRSVDQAALKLEIVKANEGFTKGLASKDVDALLHMYTEDARLILPHMPAFDGKENIRQFIQHIVQQGLTEINHTTEDVTGTDEFAIETGRYELKAGDQKIDEGKYLVHWKKVDGKWLLHREMAATDAPLPQQVAQTEDPK